MILNEKSLNYKFINLDEIYNFHTTFISIRTQTKKIMIFWKLICPYPVPNGGRDCHITRALPVAPYGHLKCGDSS